MKKNRFLIEILTEEVPFLEHKNVKSSIVEFFKERSFFKEVEVFQSPERLVIFVTNFEDYFVNEAKKIKGPSVNANTIAIEGFLKKNNIKIEDVEQENGVYIFEKPEEKLKIDQFLKISIIPALFQVIKNSFSKTMIWNESRELWIRPIKNILILLNETLIEYNFAQIKSKNTTIINFSQTETLNCQNYFEIIKKNNILLDFNERLNKIRLEIKKIEEEQNLECLSSESLFLENAFLSSFPEVCFAKFDEKYLQLPEKVIILSLEKNQKYFLFKNRKDGKLCNFFAITINGKFEKSVQNNIIEGNKRVLSARLEDAIYYVKIDLRFKLHHYNEMLKKVVFHKNVGSVYERILRMQNLANSLNLPEKIKQDLRTAIELSKSDLQTEMVLSFTELQGYIGAFYAKKEGYSEEICNAIENQYKLGIENIKAGKLAYYLAFVEKFEKVESLVKAGEIPTSSRDPFGIRRDILAIIKILIEGELEITINCSSVLVEILKDRMEFYFKNFSKEALNFVLNQVNFEQLNLFSVYKKIIKLEEDLPKLEEYKRIFNILNSPEAEQFKGFEIETSKLSSFESLLINEFNKSLSADEYFKKSNLIVKFFENYMMLDKNDVTASQNRIAILQLISSNIVKLYSC